jgi:hypothetical protein
MLTSAAAVCVPYRVGDFLYVHTDTFDVEASSSEEEEQESEEEEDADKENKVRCQHLAVLLLLVQLPDCLLLVPAV